MFTAMVATVGTVAGAIAAVAGFGIGSLLTPLLALEMGTKGAVAAVSIPHLWGTVLRSWLLREHVDRRVLWSFGLTSAAGGLAGALLHSRANNPVLRLVFAGLLIFAGVMGVTGLAQKLEFKGAWAWIAGALSGLFGGLVGNQGGHPVGSHAGLECAPRCLCCHRYGDCADGGWRKDARVPPDGGGPALAGLAARGGG